ncbi:hypothetical protein SteCoe_23225 [Stentor coeruleus]|uniref:Uncharacterized protein n=1 Tax=Stentor coeruleus TaxID=5963 RepID=A0A1R2BKE1_9CILI|nr:hypothetical protein SteCoe_23225 [Stentor coeruleus]
MIETSFRKSIEEAQKYYKKARSLKLAFENLNSLFIDSCDRLEKISESLSNDSDMSVKTFQSTLYILINYLKPLKNISQNSLLVFKSTENQVNSAINQINNEEIECCKIIKKKGGHSAIENCIVRVKFLVNNCQEIIEKNLYECAKDFFDGIGRFSTHESVVSTKSSKKDYSRNDSGRGMFVRRSMSKNFFSENAPLVEISRLNTQKKLGFPTLSSNNME